MSADSRAADREMAAMLMRLPQHTAPGQGKAKAARHRAFMAQFRPGLVGTAAFRRRLSGRR